MVDSFKNMTPLNRPSATFASKHGSGAHCVGAEDKSNSSTGSTTRTLSKIAKVFVGVSILVAAAYGEGVVHWLALFALLMVYLVSVG